MMRVQGCPGSQSHPAKKAGGRGGEGGADGNESEDETECEVEAVAAGRGAVDPAVAGEWSGYGSEKSAKPGVERD